MSESLFLSYKLVLLFCFLMGIFNTLMSDNVFCTNKRLSPLVENACALNNKVASLSSQSAVDCASHCFNDVRCISFFFNTGEAACALFTRNISDLNLINQTNWFGYTIQEADRTPEPEQSYVELWVDSVTNYSSQYAESHGALTMVGPPDVYPAHGDIAGAWAARYWSHGPQWVQVAFAEVLYIFKIVIYETFNAGCTLQVEALNMEDESWDLIWTTPGLFHVSETRLLNITPESLTFTDELKVTIDAVMAGWWAELDAVLVSGYPEDDN